MSYCVNCGVELAPSEKRCPLCGVEVVNPAKPWTEPEALPYSDNAERIRRIDRRYLAGLISLVLLIPAVVCMFCDILDGRLSWSLLVTGALLNVFVIFLIPMMLHRPSALLLIALDTVSTSAYLLLIRIACGLPASGKDWLLPLALPIVLLTAILAAAFSLWLRKRRPIALICAFAFLSVGILTVGINLLVNLYCGLALMPVWSLYSMLPCLVLFVFFLVLNKRNRWKDGIRKRLFV